MWEVLKQSGWGGDCRVGRHSRQEGSKLNPDAMRIGGMFEVRGKGGGQLHWERKGMGQDPAVSFL